jgi:hypothetical protein
MKLLSAKSLIAIGSSIMLGLIAGQVLSTPTPRPTADSARQQVAQYCVPHEDGEIGAQDIFC